MACGEFGFGRMSEPDSIADAAGGHFVEWTVKKVSTSSLPLAPRMNPSIPCAISLTDHRDHRARQSPMHCRRWVRGSVYITGPASAEMPEGCDIIRVETAREMLDAVQVAVAM